MSALRLLAPVAIRPLIEELVARFEEVNHLQVSMDFALDPEVRDRVMEGDTPDLILTHPDYIRSLIETDLASEELHRPFGRLALALGRACEMCDPLRTVPELRDLLTGAGEIAYTEEGTSGNRLLTALEELEIAEEVTPKLRPMGAGEPARAAAAGKVDLAAAALPVILDTEGLNPVALMPGTLGTDIDISVTLSLPGVERDAAHDLLNFLSSKDNDPALKEHGVARFKFT